MDKANVITLETAHLYGVDAPFYGEGVEPDLTRVRNENFHFETILGKRIEDYLTIYGKRTVRLWFHDDIIPRIEQENSTGNKWRWGAFMERTRNHVVTMLQAQGIEESNVPSESNLDIQNEYDFIQEAEEKSIPEIIGSLQCRDDWSFDEEKNTLRGPTIKKEGKKHRQRIRLKGYREHTDIPSCEVLDYTFYKNRLEMSSPTITLIGENMKEQQERVRQLFTLIGKKPEVIVLFHNGEKIMEGEYWGEGENENILPDILRQDF